MTNAAAEEAKAKGNAALQAGNLSDAIQNYTTAINLDGSNHVYYSNRSAAFLQKGDAHAALDDANACLGLNPDFTKGYSRKGAALHSLKRYNDSIAAYQEGLAKFPNDAGLNKGLESVTRDKDKKPGMTTGGAAGGLFSPQMMAQMALNPKLRPYLADPDTMAKIKMIQDNPQLATTMLTSDPKLMELLGIMMGGDAEEEASSTPTSTASKPKEPEPMQVDKVEEEEDDSDLTPAELEAKQKKKQAVACKEEGNALYKEKKFEEALAKYDEARQLDPANMTFLSNQAAVLFTQKKYAECVTKCIEAVEIGKDNRAPFEDRAKAYTRAARAYQKLGDLDKAIDMCNEAQLESYDKATQRLLKTMELERKKTKAAAYLDDDKAEEAKQRGNEHFRAKEYPAAVNEYEEAVKRAPKNAAIRNNLAAALCKIMDFNGAKREIEVAIDLDPKYVKAWARKGDIELLMKENHRAIESYKKGLELDPNNAACKEGMRKVQMSMGSQMSEEEQKERAAHAMADPEIQAILTDPVVRQVLQDFNENPQAAQQAMLDPVMRGKIEKLIASGVVQTA